MTIGNNEIVFNSVKDYINRPDNGALLLFGAWGCGKTYFLKHELKEYLQKNNRMLIIVSLFGIHDLKEIPSKIFYSYIDSFGANSLKLNTTNVVKYVKKIQSFLPKTKEYINLDNISILENNAYRALPKNKVIICFDDLERKDQSIPLNDMLGTINNIVENIGFKVIVVANEERLSGSDDKNKIDIFKEKVIYKSISFIPDIIDIFKGIVNEYSDSNFTHFMNSNYIIDSVNPNKGDKSKTYKNGIINIRNLKFAVSHFFDVFSLYKNYEGDNYDLKMKNYWIFILSVTIEYKNNHISYNIDHNLREYKYSDVAEVNLSTFDESDTVDLFEEDDEKCNSNDDVEFNNKYCHNFYEKYYLPIKEHKFFHNELFNFITAGIPVNFDVLDKNINSLIKKYIHTITDAEVLFNQFMQGIYNFSNEEVVINLNQLLDYVEDARFKGFTQYINSYTFLNSYKDLIPISKNDLDIRVKKGIDKYISELDFDPFLIRDLGYFKRTISEVSVEISDYMMEKFLDLENNLTKGEIKNLERIFSEDLVKLCVYLVDNMDNHCNKYHIPVLKDFTKKLIEDKFDNIQPKEVVYLTRLIKFRYTEDVSNSLFFTEERQFLINVREVIDEMDLEKETLSNLYIKSKLKPVLSKILGSL